MPRHMLRVSASNVGHTSSRTSSSGPATSRGAGWTLLRVLGLLIAPVLAPCAASAEIIWSGDYETGNFLQWYRQDDPSVALLAGIPQYGRPPRAAQESRNRPDDYYGDGSLLTIVTHPVRQGRYAARFTVRNSRNGSEPRDCDGGGGQHCQRRRTELWAHRILPLMYDGMPYGSERWISISHFVPADWERAGSGSGPHVFQIKPYNDQNGIGPCFSIQIKSDGWLLNHRWTDDRNYNRNGVPWSQRVEYTSRFPAPNGGDGGADLRADFPNQRVSQAALADLNEGGWTDWVIHMRFDSRGSARGGRGFLTVWKRAGEGDWIKVLHVEPRRVSHNGERFDRGICYNSPRRGNSNPGGFGVLAGMYMSKDQVWNLSRDRVIYNDNIKVGSERAVFADMSPDGSAPGDAARPRPRAPRLLIETTSRDMTPR